MGLKRNVKTDSKARKSHDSIQALTSALAAKDEMIAALTTQVAMLNDQVGKLLSQVAALTGCGPDVEKDKGKNKDCDTKVPDASPSQPNLSLDEGGATVKSSKARKDVGEKRPPLKLRTLDWNVPIITPGQVRCSGISKKKKKRS